MAEFVKPKSSNMLKIAAVLLPYTALIIYLTLLVK